MAKVTDSRYITDNPNIIPGFFHIDLAGNVLPKLKMPQEFGFYRQLDQPRPEPDSCGAHTPRHAPHELATSA